MTLKERRRAVALVKQTGASCAIARFKIAKFGRTFKAECFLAIIQPIFTAYTFRNGQGE